MSGFSIPTNSNGLTAIFGVSGIISVLGGVSGVDVGGKFGIGFLEKA